MLENTSPAGTPVQKPKPTVRIKNCRILPDCWQGKNTILTGYPVDYPDDHQAFPGALRNGAEIFTSKIVSISEDRSTVETLRTIYKVLNWV